MKVFSVNFCLTSIIYLLKVEDISGSRDYWTPDYWSDSFDSSQNCENKGRRKISISICPGG